MKDTLQCPICGSQKPWGGADKDRREGERCATARCPGRLMPPHKRDLDAEMEAHRIRMRRIL